MKACATLKKNGDIIESVTAEISEPGDLYALVKSVYELARKNGRDLWDSSLEIT